MERIRTLMGYENGLPLFEAMEYPAQQLARFACQAAQWVLHSQHELSYIAYEDATQQDIPLTCDHYVVSGGQLIGFYYDGCLFLFDSPATHKMTNYNPDHRLLWGGGNCIGCIHYTLFRKA